MSDYLPYELRKLRALKLSQERFEALDVLVLPENFDGDTERELIDAQDAITLSKMLKGRGLRVANSYDLGLQSPTLERRGNDIWLGQLYVINDVLLPVVLSVLEGMVMPLVKAKLGRRNAATPVGAIDTEIHIGRGDGYAHIRYKGDGETFLKMLDGLKPKNDAE